MPHGSIRAPFIPWRAHHGRARFHRFMSSSPPALHVYDREIHADERTSLSVLTRHIGVGARVLDLGCGSGAIGRFLAARDGAAAGPIDGLTISQEEAQRAATHYRQVEVADLDNCRLADLFAAGSYDAIVCADVLEHIRQGDRVLAECRQLLAPGGRVLLSIPNAAYAGLMGELMAGEFRYREEGLLDETHLRFFTRRTLMRFLADNGWAPESTDVVVRQLPDSEFNVAFDALPPAVARYLLALPDALTYQFIVVARPASDSEPAPPIDDSAANALPAQALFTAELYLGAAGTFDETRKLTTAGIIGDDVQSLAFQLPDVAPDGLKFDPADRPGFLHLHALALHDANGVLLWHWSSAEPAPLLGAPQDGILAQPPAWPGAPLALLLYGTDPWIKLPIPKAVLAQAGAGRLQATVGWPMSADYMALAGLAQQRIAQVELASAAARNEFATQMDAVHQHLSQAEATIDGLRQQAHGLDAQNEHLRNQRQTLLTHQLSLTRERDEARQLVHDIENSTVFRATRPLVHAKMRVDRWLGIGSARANPVAAPTPQPLAPSELPVDIIVPVYRGLEDTRRCLESVLASTCKTPWRLIVINDASPEPEVTQWLHDFAASDARITLLENEGNLGFVGTVNRGMALSGEHDVLLLNSDAEVAGDWLDRIRAAAYSDQKVASVTPFSNNATICSYPLFCRDNDLPEGWDTARLDALFGRVNSGQVVDVPTGVGFCMYIRRAALTEVGLFDVENFGKGYGEENDFCIRAANAGWRNLHALDTFVRHFGGVSFGDSKSPRERAAMETLRRLHPRYESQVLRFVQDDPARLARTMVDVGRILDGQRPVILTVLHDRQGGTERHVHELASALRDRAQFLVLRPLPGGRVSLRLPDPDEGFELVFSLADGFEQLLTVLRQLGVCHVHFHHLLGHDDMVARLPERLGVGYDFTAHDYHTVCPQISLTQRDNLYCGELGVQQCTDCLAQSPAPGGVDILTWRARHAAILNGARFVMAPARDALLRLARYVPGAALRLVPHTDIDPGTPLPVPAPAPIRDGRSLKVVVIGALSAIKGADVLEDVAVAARKQGAPVEFHLIGYGYRALKTQPHARLTVHGRYDENDLPDLLRWLQPDVVWFPAQWPETYSYTLSACLLGGWPVVAPDIGAFAERLQGRRWSWVKSWDLSMAEWLAFFTEIRDRHFVPGHSPAPVISVIETDGHVPPAVVSHEWYAAEYLQRLPSVRPDSAELDRVTLGAYLPSPGLGTLAAGARGRALRSLARLRSLPILSGVARAIPLRWQTRVKGWLLR